RKVSSDVFYLHAAGVDGSELDVDVLRDLQSEIHLDRVAAIAVPAITSVVAMAAERPIHIKLQQIRLFGMSSFTSFFAAAIRSADSARRVFSTTSCTWSPAPPVTTMEPNTLSTSRVLCAAGSENVFRMVSCSCKLMEEPESSSSCQPAPSADAVDALACQASSRTRPTVITMSR